MWRESTGVFLPLEKGDVLCPKRELGHSARCCGKLDGSFPLPLTIFCHPQMWAHLCQPPMARARALGWVSVGHLPAPPRPARSECSHRPPTQAPGNVPAQKEVNGLCQSYPRRRESGLFWVDQPKEEFSSHLHCPRKDSQRR